MAKIGDKYINVKTFKKCMVVHVKEATLGSQGQVLVKHDEKMGAREWLTDQKLEDEYVEDFKAIE